MLHSIPPMGGIPPSIRCGRSARPSAVQDIFRPRAIAPATNTGAQRTRDAFRKALAMKRDQLRNILADLEAQKDKALLAEAEFVRGQLKSLMGGDNEQ